MSVYLEEPCCPPVGEVPQSDFDVCAKVAEKLGKDYYDVYTDNLSEEERVRFFYKASGCEERMSWEEFKEKRIYIVPCKPNAQDLPAGLYDFYKDPGKSSAVHADRQAGILLVAYRAVYARWTTNVHPSPNGLRRAITHDERLSSERTKDYPLLCMSNHGRWRMHAQCDDIVWNREVETMKIRGQGRLSI